MSMKEAVRIRGRTRLQEAVHVGGTVLVVGGRALRIARVKDEWFGERVVDPALLVRGLRDSGRRVDLFTFVQRFPDTSPRFSYFTETERVAATTFSSYADWHDRQVTKEVRKKLRKAAKVGVRCRIEPFNDALVQSIVDIYNESPIRQGKRFWHYGKDFATVKAEAATYLDQSVFIGAFHEETMVGFIKLVFLEGCASTMHVVSKISERDKAPTNALIAKAVEICADRGLQHLTYGNWTDGTLGDFKRQSGFAPSPVPRYYVPLNTFGTLAVRCGVHRGVRELIPGWLMSGPRKMRAYWYGLRA